MKGNLAFVRMYGYLSDGFSTGTDYIDGIDIAGRSLAVVKEAFCSTEGCR